MSQADPQAGLAKQLHGLSPLALLTIVCLACTGVGAFLGSIYSLSGAVWGGIGGQLAGFIWTPIMLRLAKKGFQSGRLVASGAGVGVAAGLVGSTFLHAAMLLSEPAPFWMSWQVVLLILVFYGGVCGGIVGAVTGALCGLLVPKRKRRRWAGGHTMNGDDPDPDLPAGRCTSGAA